MMINLLNSMFYRRFQQGHKNYKSSWFIFHRQNRRKIPMKPVIGKFKNSAIPQECWGCSNQQPQQEQKQEQQMPPTPLPPMFQPPKNTITVNSSSRVACNFAVDLPTSTSPNVQLAVRLQVGVVGVVNGELSRIRKIKMNQIYPNNPCMLVYLPICFR